MATATAVTSKGGKARAGMQRFGGFLAGMVMPNIPAFIAWGLITAFFIPTGWTPNAQLDKLVNPFVMFLIPILIGYTGGKLVYGVRGAVVGVIATAGIAVGSSEPMFLGAMILGPLGGWLIKQFDKAFADRIPSGFEMLVNTFSAGILGAILAVLGFLVIEPVMTAVAVGLGAAATWVTSIHLLPLIAIFIEPGKVLFLNNAINHGILEPLGVQQAKAAGKSIFFLLETDPGPGLGILLAYWVFAKGTIRQSAPAAIIIEFLGGIHEIYFPYILMKPILVLAVIGGGICADGTFMLLHAGLVATPSPGSIFAEMIMTPKGGYFPVITGILVGAAVSFLIASFFLARSKNEMSEESLAMAQDMMQDLKLPSKTQKPADENQPVAETSVETEIALTSVPNRVIFACEAGMGSSAMGASLLKKALSDAGYNIPVDHMPVNQVPSNAKVLFTQNSFAARARQVAPDAKIYIVNNFLDKQTYQGFVEDLKKLPQSK